MWMCLCLHAVHVHRGASLGPVSQVSSDWQCCVDPVVRVLDHGDPHGHFLLRGVHPADGLPVTQTCRRRADNIPSVTHPDTVTPSYLCRRYKKMYSRSCLMKEKKIFPWKTQAEDGMPANQITVFKFNVVTTNNQQSLQRLAPPLNPAVQMNRWYFKCEIWLIHLEKLHLNLN